MVPLDSTEWRALGGGEWAEQIPGLLRQLEAAPSSLLDDPDSRAGKLWHLLCHQGQAVTAASYAAAPHLLRIGRTAPTELKWEYFLLLADIETCRLLEPSPPIPESLRESYLGTLRDLHGWAFELAAEPWNLDTTVSVLAALAASKGHAQVAYILINLPADDLQSIVDAVDGVHEPE